MATAPTQDETKKAQEATQAEIDAKLKAQQEQGKDFVIDKDGHAAGVIPEDVWKGLKS